MRTKLLTKIAPILLAGGIKYVIHDEFSDTASGAAIDGTDCDPGPGTRKVIGSDAVCDIGSGVLECSGAQAAWGDRQIRWDTAVTRAAGIVLFCDVMFDEDNPIFQVGFTTDINGIGSATDVDIEHAFYFYNDENIDAVNNGVRTEDVVACVKDTWYRLKLVLKSAGATFYISGGAHGVFGESYTQIHDDNTENSATLYPYIASRAVDNKFDNLAVYPL